MTIPAEENVGLVERITVTYRSFFKSNVSMRNLPTMLRNALSREEALKFIVVGIANTVLTFALYALTVTVTNNLTIAIIIPAIIGVAFSSIANSAYTFGQNGVRYVLFFCGVYVLTISVNIAILRLMVYSIGIDRILAQLILVAPIAVLTFVLMKVVNAKF